MGAPRAPSYQHHAVATLRYLGVYQQAVLADNGRDCAAEGGVMVHLDAESSMQGKARKQVAELTIVLDEQVADRLREIAEQRGESPEQLLASWAEGLARSSTSIAGGQNQKRYSSLDIIGSLPDIEPIRGGSREIDRLIAEEAINPHDDE